MKFFACSGVISIGPGSNKRTMLSLAVLYLVALICSARRTHAQPLYPDTNLEPQAGESIFYLHNFFFKALDSLCNFLTVSEGFLHFIRG